MSAWANHSLFGEFCVRDMKKRRAVWGHVDRPFHIVAVEVPSRGDALGVYADLRMSFLRAAMRKMAFAAP